MDSGMMKNENILEIALDLQKEKGWISDADVIAIAEAKKLPPARVYETLSFYSMILLKAPAKVRVEVCRGTSCYNLGGKDLIAEIARITGCRPGEASGDGLYEVEYCECLGRCETAPNVIVNGKIYTSVTMESIEKIIKEAAI